jgi:hypothetical protein
MFSLRPIGFNFYFFEIMELVVGRTTVDLQGCVVNEFFIAILILAMVHCVM